MKLLWVLLLGACASFQNHTVPIGERPQAKVVNHANFRVRVEVEAGDFGAHVLGYVNPNDSVIFKVPIGDVALTVNFYGPNNIWVATYYAEPLSDATAQEWRWEVIPKQ